MTVNALSTTLIVAVSIVNLVPMAGVLSASRLEALYGARLEGADLEILMRHRALLFGVVGGLLAASAFRTPLRPVAFAAGLFSMLSFVAIAGLVGDFNDALRRVVIVDVVASVALVAAAILDHRAQRSPAGSIAFRDRPS